MAFPTRSLATADELSSLQQLLPGSTVVVLAVDAQRGVLVPKQMVGPAAGRLRDLTIDVGYHVSGWVAANWVPMVNADAQLDLDIRAHDLRYALSMPLICDHRLVGVLTIYSVEPASDVLLQRAELMMPALAEALAPPVDVDAPALVRNLRLVIRR
jgi:hypothetical protein